MKITSEQLQRWLEHRDRFRAKLSLVRAGALAAFYGAWRGYRIIDAENPAGGLLVRCTVRGSVALRSLRVVRVHWNPTQLTVEQIEAGFGTLPPASPAQERTMREEGLTRIR